MSKSLSNIIKRTEWFRHDRFGMFIHWGVYSIPGKGEWIRSHQEISVEDYQEYVDTFNPTKYDPKQWAKMAKEAGMKYVVMTAKHHDGYCLFDSKYTDYKSTNSPIGKDLVKEFVEAVRAEGLQVGLYFSLIDWYHNDYPKYGDMIHPMRNNEAYKDESIDFDNYLSDMHGQIEELLTQYGLLDILWFDYSYDDMTGEKWQATKIMEMVRKHQPQAITDNRLETSGSGQGSIVTDSITDYSGDFVSPEQLVPHEGIRNHAGKFVPWELCVTMNNNWAYNPTDYLYKSPKTLIRKLVECVSKNGNMLLNVGPDALGVINDESQYILREFGQWMEDHKESIYGCGYADIPKPEWGYYTRNDHIIYAHVFEDPIGPLALTGIDKDQVESVRWLHDDSEVKISNSWTTESYQDVLFVQFGEVPHFTYPLPNKIDSVLKITLKGS
ncbi:alpha-L-fucosidase [Dolosigranulum savutiense]|uniref:alpha-L-fucosidase n=1 Tax=Dolosigranulum savutiense TaxID=3110288 RepID=A0AB74U6U0_9LACT